MSNCSHDCGNCSANCGERTAPQSLIEPMNCLSPETILYSASNTYPQSHAFSPTSFPFLVKTYVFFWR